MSSRDSENSQLLVDDSDTENHEENERPPKKSICSNPFIPISVLLALALLIVSGLWIFQKPSGSENVSSQLTGNPCPKARNLCESPVCATVAHQLQTWHDEEIDPCVDFYQHSCGKYNQHSLAEGTRVAEKDLIIKRLISDFAKSRKNSTSRSENAVVRMYNKCIELMDPTNGKAFVKDFLRSLIADVGKIGKWPTADKSWKEEDFNLNDMLSNMSQLHVLDFGLFSVNAFEAPVNESKKHLIVQPGTRVLSRENDVTALLAAVKAILDANDTNYTVNAVLSDLEEFMVLKEKFQTFRIRSFETRPFSELQAANPNIDFERILRNMPHATKGNWTALRETAVAADIDFLVGAESSLDAIIRKTEPRMLANFLIFKFILHSMEFFIMHEKETENQPCIEFLANTLPRATLRIFVRNYFKKENLKIASEMIDEMRSSYVEMIDNATWLNDSTKANLVTKVKALRRMVGYSEDYEQKGALDRMFETLSLTPSDSFYTIFCKVNRFRMEQLMDYILSASTLNPTLSLFKTNAFYFTAKNSIDIMAPFLDDPFFDSSLPRYVNMAGVGKVLAHEIGHAFDTLGVFFDQNGRYVESSMWTPSDLKTYEKRVRCLVKQFDEFDDSDYGHKLNGSRVVSELVADGLGNEAVWKAFQKIDMSNEPTLTGFGNYSIQKLFFRIGALDFCAPREHRSYGKDKILTHPTNRFRVNGAFANVAAFAKAFNCPVGSPMNPEKKCTFF